MTIVTPKARREDGLNLFFEPEGRLRMTSGDKSSVSYTHL